MKKIKKITALVILTIMLLANIPLSSAEWIHNDDILHHSFPPLMSKEERNATKDRQLCKTATSFDILNKDGTVKYTYYPQGCKSETENLNFKKINRLETKKTINNSKDDDTEEIDNFIKNIFSIEDKKEVKEENIIDTKIKIEDTKTEIKDIKDANTSTGDTLDSSGDADLDNIFKDIFNTWYKTNTNLKGSKFAKALRNYSKEKITIKVWAVKANVLGSDMNYNSKVAVLLNKIDKELKIDSIKNSLAKNISNVSFSLSTYQNTTDAETKEVFKNKLINDIKTLKKKYKILKNKDAMISKTLEKRWLL